MNSNIKTDKVHS